MDALTQPVPLSLIVIAYLCIGKALLEWAKQEQPGKTFRCVKRVGLVAGWLPLALWLVVKIVTGRHTPQAPRPAQGAEKDAEEEKPTKPV